ncbi:TlpA family protein disulfide reductase [Belliella sp. R4-6]|uniref:TlpA family protein disulfide reductase n=1 Tax=Belliella alkalica TaxID=1730871 RepID=A0ABS9VD04_9BACT|nr:TlpA family protein disulfide reductase [Belliella alkalica]MCH7414322.1 TlpA family protein disulfide reductase [Belliella alkalica]
MKKQITLLIAMLLSVYAFGQQKLEPLDIGDKLPNLKFEDVLNHPDGEILISDYKGKLLILDFWATWCAPCVASFPKLDSLDKAFGDELAILPVTYQDKEDVEKLFSRMAKLKEIKKPMVYGDNTLRELFPHQTLPHYVWVGKDGEVVAITYREEISEANISAMIRGDQKALGEKKDKVVAFDRNKPLLAGNTDFGNTQILYQSALTRHVEGLPNALEIVRDENRRIVKFLFTNTSIKYLFAMGLSDGKGLFPSKMIDIDVEDPSKISSSETGSAYLQWKLGGNSYCYELIVPDVSEPEKWALLKQEITKLFPQYVVSFEERDMPVLALKTTADPAVLKSKGGTSKHEFNSHSAALNNTRIDMLVGHLNLLYLSNDPRPVVNKSGIDFPIDLHLESKLSDVEALNQALSAYGLILKEELHPMEKMIIRDNLNFE